MAGIGDFLKEKTGLADAAKSLQGAKEGAKAIAAPPPPGPPANPNEPVPPKNTKQQIADAMKKVDQVVQVVKKLSDALGSATSVLGVIADPGAALAGALGAAADEKMNKLVSGLAKAIGPFPAATLTGMALGIPHAHVKHPPSGPPPIPPIPLPPMGPILLGTCLRVLVNNKPTARCGDFGLNPTCMGIVPPLSAMYEIITGSSNVYFGGARAARSGIDITMHCFHVPSPKITLKVGKLAGALNKAGKAAGKVMKAAGKVMAVVGKVTKVVNIASQVSQTAKAFADAEAADDGATAAAIAMNVAMMAAQAAADKAAAALTKQMGTDQPFIPPIGTPGLILDGSPNVMLGGFPLPNFSAIAQGIMKRVKGIKFEDGERGPVVPRAGDGSERGGRFPIGRANQADWKIGRHANNKFGSKS